MAKISSNVFGAIIALVISITLYFGYDLVMDEIQSYPRVGCRIEKFICPNNLIPGVELNCTLEVMSILKTLCHILFVMLTWKVLYAVFVVDQGIGNIGGRFTKCPTEKDMLLAGFVCISRRALPIFLRHVLTNPKFCFSIF
ncbi:unnamed protein product [Caenorhabditis angaria]|uniref:Uncharacterized protein n=1 Tax=Caenorhabditis angaria TaxID=860376 RepID=A0A9P1N492_9PELO|nr:unnamed protein product [Caenorhabditis angaria]